MQAPAIIWDTVEAMGEWARTAEWDITARRYRSRLSVDDLCSVLRALEASFDDCSVVRLDLFVDVEDDVDEIRLRGTGAVDSLEQKHAGRTVSRGAEAVFSLPLWVQDQSAAVQRGPVEPAGRLWVGDEGGEVSVTLVLSVNVYSDTVLVAKATSVGHEYQPMAFSHAAERNRALVSEGLRAFLGHVDGNVDSWDSDVLEERSIDATGILEPGYLRADERPVLRSVCAFRELGMGPERPSVRDTPTCPRLREKAAVLEYLRTGPRIVMTPGLLKDAFDETITAGAPHQRTDGVFVWSEVLAYYVDKYDIALPDEFLTHARDNQWKIPDDIDVGALRL